MASRPKAKGTVKRVAARARSATRTATAKAKVVAKKTVRAVRAAAKKATKAPVGKRPARSVPRIPASKMPAKAPAPALSARMPQAGETAPSFLLGDAQGKLVRLEDLRGKKVALYFYPKDDTPGCTLEAHEFSALREQFERKGAAVLGVSRDSAQSHRDFASKCGLTVTLLSDHTGDVCMRYGVIGRKTMYGKEYVGILRTTFIIGRDGRIERVFKDVNPAGHAKDVLASI